MKKSMFNIVAGIAALLFAVVLKAYCVVSNSDAAFFDILAALLGIAGWVFFVAEAIYRKKDGETDLENIYEANEAAFESADSLPVMNADNLFTKEFDVSIDEDTTVNTAEVYSEGLGTEQLVFVDKDLSYEGAVADFAATAREKGYEFEEKEARKIFSAMASSRIIITKGLKDGEFKDFMVLLGNYFESAVYMDRVDEGYTSSESLLFKNDAHGNRVKTSMKLAFEAAYNASQKVHFAALSGVKLAELALYLAPIVKHAKNPTMHHFFTAHNERNMETSFSVPRNVWFVLNVEEGESFAYLPEAVAEIASVNDISFTACAASEEHINVRKFSYYQHEYLCEKLASRLSVDESVWKRVDRLESFVAAHAPYRIGNKLWLCLEKYIGAFMACGAEQSEAVDEGIAAKLIPTMVIAANGTFSAEEDGFVATLESIFGEDNADACKRAVKTSGADIA